MESSTITWLALGISLFSFIAAVWSAWVSHRALNHAKYTYESDQIITFNRERSELLEIINSSRKLLDRTRIEIGALKAEFDAEPIEIQEMMANYTSIFTEYLPAIEGGVRQTSALWHEVAEWGEKNGIHALVHHQARFRYLIHEDQVAHDSGFKCVGIFREKLEIARNLNKDIKKA